MRYILQLLRESILNFLLNYLRPAGYNMLLESSLDSIKIVRQPTKQLVYESEILYHIGIYNLHLVVF